jgi:hypothetical protein
MIDDFRSLLLGAVNLYEWICETKFRLGVGFAVLGLLFLVSLIWSLYSKLGWLGVILVPGLFIVRYFNQRRDY